MTLSSRQRHRCHWGRRRGICPDRETGSTGRGHHVRRDYGVSGGVVDGVTARISSQARHDGASSVSRLLGKGIPLSPLPRRRRRPSSLSWLP